MNYKKLIKSQKIRLQILKLLEFIPDKLMIKMQYRLKTGKKLNLNNPKKFNEKLQWYKLFYRQPLMTKCTDKYEVRNYIKEKGLGDILVPLYGVYSSVDDINFDNFPQSFVLKTNNGGGSSTNIICTDRRILDKKTAKNQLNEWLNSRTPKPGREWSYYNIKPKIISEKYLEDSREEGLIDYKFYCFQGETKYVKVAYENSVTGNIMNGIYDMKFKQLPYCRDDVDIINERLDKPKNFDQMKIIAEKLSEDFPHVRVDLYNINGQIYFGELTFYDTSGYQVFNFDEFDYILGSLFKLEKLNSN